ncbi:IPT/TIG domain-containing protein [Archangium lansingense]|uniref:IPT/TIG domain-containing protein n=1 Tax=Archangium lansingense TaxID=2995310 RepID=A0ABT4AB34_9BACT|nr:IPT/TIG domain-containing protein [Archangium lansinium]MCY1078835.1 IPT/TIG domain-containing protein [Archangium lansinium]
MSRFWGLFLAVTALVLGGCGDARPVSDSPRGEVRQELAAPTLTSFSPTSGEAGWSTITLNGTGLTGTRVVRFNGVAAEFTRYSDTRVTAKVPDGAFSGPITIVTDAGSASSSTSFTVIPEPEPTGFSPRYGAAGTTVTLTGNNLTGATEVSFDGDDAAFTVVDSTRITATVPSGATTGELRVYTPDGSATFGVFTVLSSAAPTITSFSPTSAGHGERVTLTGTGFTGATSVSFNGAEASVYVESDTSLYVYVPTDASTGRLRVYNSQGVGVSSSDFTILPALPAPRITGFSPTSGPVGTLVTLNGSGFTGATDVRLGNTSLAVTPNSDTQLTVTIKTGTLSGTFRVDAPGGRATSDSSFSVQSTSSPSLSSFSPSTGWVGTSVTLVGANFTGTTEVSFNGTPATSFSLSGDSYLYVNVPSGATSGPIRVVNTKGQVGSPPFTVLAAPTLTGFSPASGAVGTVVTLTGSGFAGSPSVRFGSEYADVTVVSATQLTAIVPAGATSGQLRVSVAGQSLTSTERFTVLGSAVPTLARFSPTSGEEGIDVIIDGSNFTGVSRVEFNGVPASSVSLTSDGRLSTSVPTGASTGPIRVVTSAGAVTSSTPFTVLSRPAVTSFTPARGTIGTTVTLTGTGFTRVRRVWFETSQDATFMVVSDTEMKLIVPPGARTGRITLVGESYSYSDGEFVVDANSAPTLTRISPSAGGVETFVYLYGSGFTGTTRVSFNGIPARYFFPSGDGALTVQVPPGATSGPIQVTNSVGSATSSTSFTVLPPPAVTGLSPTSGPAGTRVTLTGTGFVGTSTVRFGGVSSSRFEVLSDTQMTADVPSGAVSGPVTLSGAAGNSLASVDFTVVSGCAPFITEFSPETGGPNVMTTVRGGCFTGTTQVRINGTPARFGMSSGTSLYFWIPDGATSGPISVQNSLGTATSSQPFTVVPGPVISRISPTSGPPGTQVTITGTGLASTSWVSVTGGGGSFKVLGDTQVVFTIPWSGRTGPILLQASGGMAVSTESFTLHAVNAPTLTGFAPARAGLGTEVVLEGSGFTGLTEVRFNGVKAELFSYTGSDTRLFVVVPLGATTGPITVVNTLGSATSSASLIIDSGSAVSLTGISPARAAVGATVELSGTNLSGCQALFPGLSSGARVLSNTGTRMQVVVPESSASGVLQVRCAMGAAWIHFELVPPPRITGISPLTGPSTGGTRVNLTGSGFEPGATVSFGGVAASGVSVTDAEHLTATTPAHAAGVVDVVVSNPSGSSVTLGGGFTYEKAPAPVLTGVAPGSGPTRGGSALTLTGSNFVAGVRVTLGSVEATDVTVISANTLTATAPARAAGLVDVAVINPDGQSSVLAKGFTYLVQPAISSVTPDWGESNGGQRVTISGSGFRTGLKVRFGGAEAAGVSVLGDTSFSAFTPVHAPGVVDVEVENADGQSATRGGGFTYVASSGPSLASVSPNTGMSSGGESFTLRGGNFAPGATVRMGGASATSVTVVDSTTLTGITPANAPGTVDVVVRNPDGQTATLGASFTYSLSPAPVVMGLGPSEGTSNGGTRIFLTGRYFVPGITVHVGGVPATEVYVNDATSLAATTPAHAPGTVDVVVKAPDGQIGTLANGFTYVAAPSPSLSGISPGSGLSSGGTRVTLTGSNFAPGATVLIGGASATEVTWGASNSLMATTSARAAGTVDVVVRNPDGQLASLPGAYTYEPVPAPTLAAINPGRGPATGGTRVTLTGAHFAPGAQVLLGDVEALAVSVTSATSLSATTPAHAPGKVDVVVRNADGQGATLAGAFTYDVPPPPTVVSVAPGNGLSTGGTRVTVTGTGFGPGASVRFGGAVASGVTVTSDTSLSALLPPHAPGKVNVVVRNTDGQEGTLVGGFTYEAAPAPTLVGRSPVRGSSNGGTVVTLSGSGFAPGASVTFGGVAAPVVEVASPSSLTATTPAHAAGRVDITVTNPDGQEATLPGAFTYEAAPLPVLSSVSPTAGPPGGGTSVTLRGSGFAPGATVRFGGVAATSVLVVSDTSISTLTPAHESGWVDVEVINPDGGRAVQAGGFLYEVDGPPTVSSVSPNTGSTKGGTAITVRGLNFAPNARVTLGGAEATNVVVASATSLTATTPPHATPGTVEVSVLNPGGANGRLEGGFTYTEEPGPGEGEGNGGGGGGCAEVPGLPGAAPYLLLGLALRLRRRASRR